MLSFYKHADYIQRKELEFALIRDVCRHSSSVCYIRKLTKRSNLMISLQVESWQF